MTTPLPPLLPLPDLDTPCALWKLIAAWGRANAASDIREKAWYIDAEVHRLMKAYATAYGEAVAAALAPKWISVNERLPEPNRSVALLDLNRWENTSGDWDRNIHAAGYWHEGLNGYWSVRGERALCKESFTHWMYLPIPTPPKGETP
jgi:hypothetical protein